MLAKPLALERELAMTEMKKPQCHTEWPKPTTQKVFRSN
jgi:hypothetical protein